MKFPLFEGDAADSPVNGTRSSFEAARLFQQRNDRVLFDAQHSFLGLKNAFNRRFRRVSWQQALWVEHQQ
ncbi:MAG: hypothetical protein DWQ47_16020 [Acidobacteria bacterium]|nr:MAG: hypothetical protein DWQ32_03420 [Acidobacteriota bacterium]REK02439.1 MAG: hypothetical protein DWQ38_08715 [Acidobacteriota bacterium]REK13760.1 MAG: hypothetical protein DWQ43_09110 [Acidobacteriota bacterium]REK41754.1 MAG: hypothetical protein DWQ47_16020 [Acidobacteriota bacterium]